MPSSASSLTILSVSGPFREPREQVFSYDYAVQRSTWPTPHGVRVKISLPHELEVFKDRLLGVLTGSPGQQLMITNLLAKNLAGWKIQIAETEGFFLERRDVMLAPFVGPLAHLFAKLEERFQAERAVIREEVKQRVGL
ncbi:MAG TPA: hypothetical protein PKD12_04215 [Nitrospira sp.]|nr:hypothetical protein [Nitrospira sp.]